MSGSPRCVRIFRIGPGSDLGAYQFKQTEPQVDVGLFFSALPQEARAHYNARVSAFSIEPGLAADLNLLLPPTARHTDGERVTSVVVWPWECHYPAPARGKTHLCVTTCPDRWLGVLGRGTPTVASVATPSRAYVSHDDVKTIVVSDERDDTGFFNVAFDKALQSVNEMRSASAHGYQTQISPSAHMRSTRRGRASNGSAPSRRSAQPRWAIRNSVASSPRRSIRLCRGVYPAATPGLSTGIGSRLLVTCPQAG